MNAEYAIIDPEHQADAHQAYMRKAAFFSLIAVILAQLRGFGEQRYQRHLGADILKTTLKRVLLAPVNTFFDITPVGKILRIFQDEIHIFRRHLFDPLKHICGMLSHVVVVVSLMLTIGFWETIIAAGIFIFLCSKIMPRYLSADN